MKPALAAREQGLKQPGGRKAGAVTVEGQLGGTDPKCGQARGPRPLDGSALVAPMGVCAPSSSKVQETGLEDATGLAGQPQSPPSAGETHSLLRPADC